VDRTPEERVDAAIDVTVRAMLDVEPRADLRARVIGRLERPRRTLSWPWLVAPIAAAAVLLLAVILRTPEQRLASRPVTGIVLPAPAVSREPTAISIAAPAVVRIAQRVEAHRRGTAAAFVAPEPARPTIILEPLGSIDAISIAPVALPSLHIQQIGIPPLAPIGAIDIDPVNPSAGRN
jgi:hypothetical protein